MTSVSGAIDRNSPMPFYFQLRRILEEQLLSGRWGKGDQIPSESVLSKHFRLSRTTVRQALTALEQEGLIRKEKGRGAFVERTQPGSWLLQSTEGFFEDEASRHGVAVESTVLRAKVETLPAWAAQLLQLAEGTEGVTLERLRAVEGNVAIFAINHLPVEYADAVLALVEDPNKSLYIGLRERYGVSTVHSTRVLEAVPASNKLAELLQVPGRFPLVNVESVSWNREGLPFDCYRAWLRSDRTRIVMETQARHAASGVTIGTTQVELASASVH